MIVFSIRVNVQDHYNSSTQADQDACVSVAGEKSRLHSSGPIRKAVEILRDFWRLHRIVQRLTHQRQHIVIVIRYLNLLLDRSLSQSYHVSITIRVLECSIPFKARFQTSSSC